MHCYPLEIIRKICYNLGYNVGAGIPVGVYASLAHNHQEMMSCQITISAGIVFCLAGGTRYSIVYILPHLSKHVKRFAKFFQYLKTDALRPTPHQSSNVDSFPLRGSLSSSAIPLSLPLEGKVACAARRMRCRTRSVR